LLRRTGVSSPFERIAIFITLPSSYSGSPSAVKAERLVIFISEMKVYTINSIERTLRLERIYTKKMTHRVSHKN
jgi:hypothetical protein